MLDIFPFRTLESQEAITMQEMEICVKKGKNEVIFIVNLFCCLIINFYSRIWVWLCFIIYFEVRPLYQMVGVSNLLKLVRTGNVLWLLIKSLHRSVLWNTAARIRSLCKSWLLCNNTIYIYI